MNNEREYREGWYVFPCLKNPRRIEKGLEPMWPFRWYATEQEAQAEIKFREEQKKILRESTS